MTARLAQGLLVAFEGIDGSGKSTQAAMLADHLEAEGYAVVRTREPTDGPVGTRLRNQAADGRMSPREEFEAFLADRTQHVEGLIAPSLTAGKVVVVDRYYYSSAAYQGARGIDPQEILSANERIAPRPDFGVLVEIPVAVGLERIATRGIATSVFEQEESLRRCAEIFDSVWPAEFLRVDGTLERGTLAIQIWKSFQDRRLSNRSPHGL